MRGRLKRPRAPTTDIRAYVRDTRRPRQTLKVDAIERFQPCIGLPGWSRNP